MNKEDLKLCKREFEEWFSNGKNSGLMSADENWEAWKESWRIQQEKLDAMAGIVERLITILVENFLECPIDIIEIYLENYNVNK